MTDSFEGFAGRAKLTSIPETFFSELLPLIDDLAELKLTLWCMWALQQREGTYRHLTQTDFTANEALLVGLQTARPDEDPQATLTDALKRAVERGTLLSRCISYNGEEITVYLMNTERGREAAEAVEQGRVAWVSERQVEILPPRPNIYRLYETEIGPLTPMIRDELLDLQKTYPASWLPGAIRIATEQQARNLKYIRAVLERWRKEGKTDEAIGRSSSSVFGQKQSGGNGEYTAGEDASWFDN